MFFSLRVLRVLRGKEQSIFDEPAYFSCRNAVFFPINPAVFPGRRRRLCVPPAACRYRNPSPVVGFSNATAMKDFGKKRISCQVRQLRLDNLQRLNMLSREAFNHFQH